MKIRITGLEVTEEFGIYTSAQPTSIRVQARQLDGPFGSLNIFATLHPGAVSPYVIGEELPWSEFIDRMRLAGATEATAVPEAAPGIVEQMINDGSIGTGPDRNAPESEPEDVRDARAGLRSGISSGWCGVAHWSDDPIVTCTRAKGHEGDHIDIDSVIGKKVTRWPQADAVTDHDASGLLGTTLEAIGQPARTEPLPEEAL